MLLLLICFLRNLTGFFLSLFHSIFISPFSYQGNHLSQQYHHIYSFAQPKTHTKEVPELLYPNQYQQNSRFPCYAIFRIYFTQSIQFKLYLKDLILFFPLLSDYVTNSINMSVSAHIQLQGILHLCFICKNVVV